MEQRMTPCGMAGRSPGHIGWHNVHSTPVNARGGFILITVLVITMVGLLFGAGALLLFRFQCQMRIDRQHELEKVYAVRSALNYVRLNDKEIELQGKPFRYHTGSGRNLGLLVKPVELIFPNINNSRHFFMTEDSHFLLNQSKQYSRRHDYEYGSVINGDFYNPSNALGKFKPGNDKLFGLAFLDTTNVMNNATKWWVNIGMPDTGGWLQEDYGRRYYFELVDYVGNGEAYNGDVTRLCIIRNVTNESNKAGCRYGWPLSEGERAIVFQMMPMAGGNESNPNAIISLFEYECRGGMVISKPLLSMNNCPSVNHYMGVQIAGNKVTAFYVKNDGGGSLYRSPYTFSASKELTIETYKYFAEEVSVGGRTYCGIYTNKVDGRVYAPELRAVFEVEAASDKRDGRTPSSNLGFITDFRVTPAYQYDIFLEHPVAVTNRATVAQKIGRTGRTGANLTVLTYDTHGTEHKGFRRDERDYDREQLKKRKNGK